MRPLGRLGPNPQLAPIALRRRRLGLGDLTGFDQKIADPNYAAAWAPVANQLQAEGVDALSIQDVQGQFDDAFTQMSSSLGVEDVSDALNGAQQYVMYGKTIQGAVKVAEGLLQQAKGVDSPQAAAAFTGSMIGAFVTAATAAGVVSAGVGAAITAVVGITIAIVDALLPPNTAPAGTQVCSGFYCQGATSTIGCCCVYPLNAVSGKGAVGPASANWRRFPKQILNGEPYAPDAWWFTPQGTSETTTPFGGGNITSALGTTGDGYVTWNGAKYAIPTLGTRSLRPIDLAYPQYMQLAECDLANPLGGKVSPIPEMLTAFNNAFVSAWKANAEYALNSLQPQSDAIVLLHLIRLWNKSHAEGTAATGGKGFSLAPATGQLATDITGTIGGCQPTPYISYLQQITQEAVNATGQNDSALDPNNNHNLYIHTGPALTPPAAAPIVAAPGTGALGTALAVGGGALAVGAGAVGIYAAHTGVSFTQALGNLARMARLIR